MAISPCTLAVLSSQDVATFERVLAKLDRWFSTGTQGSTGAPKSVSVQPQTNGIGTPVSTLNLNKISTAIIVPSSATALYMAFSGSGFGVVTNSVPQNGAFLAGGLVFTFGPEYCGDIYLLNCGSSAVSVGVIEILRDDSVFS